MLRGAIRLTLLGAALTASAQTADQEKPLREAVWGGRWREGVRLYHELESAGAAPSPQASYLAGLAHWKLRRPEEARAPSTAPILDSLPHVAQTGRRLFGTAPPVRFYLFEGTPACQRFFDLFDDGRKGRAAPAHSTGMVNMVLLCAEKAHRPTEAETVSMGMHETMHAWAATYLREKYDRPIPLPPYVDEGLATYVAGLSSPEAAARPAQRLALWLGKGFAAPPLEALRRPESFYARAPADYFLSEQLIERLIGPPEKGAAKVRELLDAFAATGDDRKAWRQVSGKDVEAEYEALAAGR